MIIGLILVNCHLLLIFAQTCLTQISPDVLSGLIWIQTVCTLMVETTCSVASGLSMTLKKETMLMFVNALPTILVLSADNLCNRMNPDVWPDLNPICLTL